MCGDSTITRKVRLPRELYGRLQWAADTYQVEGGVSGIVRRALRLAGRGGVARGVCCVPATREGSTVLTVFLPSYLAAVLDGMSGADVCTLIAAYLDLPRPPPPQLYLEPAACGYSVIPMEDLADGWKEAQA